MNPSYQFENLDLENPYLHFVSPSHTEFLQHSRANSSRGQRYYDAELESVNQEIRLSATTRSS